MTKRKSGKKIVVAAAVFIICLAAPRAFGATEAKDPFCKNITQLSDRILTRFESAKDKIRTRQTEILDQIGKNRQSREERVAEARSQWDQRRAQQFQAMLNKADTDQKKKVVAVFQQAIEIAVKAKRDAISAAKDQYLEDFDALIAARNEQANDAAGKYGAAVKAALGSASSGCAAGNDTKAIRLELVNALKAAKEEFRIERAVLGKTGADAIKEKRDKTVKAAQDEFKAAIEKARQDLKEALGAEGIKDPKDPEN
jgi:hypothetical protein